LISLPAASKAKQLMSISIGLWRVNLSVMGAVSSIARLLKGARCPVVKFIKVPLYDLMLCITFDSNNSLPSQYAEPYKKQ